MGQTSKTMYTLLFYDNGKVVEALSTSNFKLVRKEYSRHYNQTGIAPRLLIDGVRQPIHKADKLMGHSMGCIIRKRSKTQYADRHHLKEAGTDEN